MKTYTCPVCGFGMAEPPADFNICLCCGTEFGVGVSGHVLSDLRELWMRGGMRWWSVFSASPANWDPYTQVNSLFENMISLTARRVAGNLDRMLSAEGNVTQNIDARGALGVSRDAHDSPLAMVA